MKIARIIYYNIFIYTVSTDFKNIQRDEKNQEIYKEKAKKIRNNQKYVVFSRLLDLNMNTEYYRHLKVEVIGKKKRKKKLLKIKNQKKNRKLF